MRNQANRKRTAAPAFALALLVGGGLFAATSVRAQPAVTDSNSAFRRNDAVSVTADHHYNSPAERANDALLITEVKNALANDGVADGYPVAVDCDHGKVRLSGVVKTAQDAKHAGDIAAAAEGVTGVNDQLTWH
jgi:osmotically-inducible protein OsmY